MDVEALERSANEDAGPSAGWDDVTRCLWFAKAGRWDEAHELCQEIPGFSGAWIHAWLHRKEGDYGNACYWYTQAGKPAVAEGSCLDEEWRTIALELL